MIVVHLSINDVIYCNIIYIFLKIDIFYSKILGNSSKTTMQTVLPVEVIIPVATQLETTYSEYREHSPQVGNGRNNSFQKTERMDQTPECSKTRHFYDTSNFPRNQQNV